MQAAPANSGNNPCKRRRVTRINPKNNREAVPVAAILPKIVAKLVEQADTTDKTEQVDPEVFSEFVKSLSQQKQPA